MDSINSRTSSFIAAAIAALGVTYASEAFAQPDKGASVGVIINSTADFEKPLASFGPWVVTKTYGRCWRPAGNGIAWRPYSSGTWIWTDCGWFWETDEPWGWACYHYGSWIQDATYGWVWVPGSEWAPAWVIWRTGGGYVGWAPWAPRGGYVAPSVFAFVEVGHFQEPIRPANLAVNNIVIVNKTTQIVIPKRETRVVEGREQRMVVNEGPRVAVVEQATGKKLSAAPVQQVASRTVVPASVRPPERETRPVPSTQTPPESHTEPVIKPSQPLAPREEERRGNIDPGGRLRSPRDFDHGGSPRDDDGNRGL